MQFIYYINDNMLMIATKAKAKSYQSMIQVDGMEIKKICSCINIFSSPKLESPATT